MTMGLFAESTGLYDILALPICFDGQKVLSVCNTTLLVPYAAIYNTKNSKDMVDEPTD